MKKAGSSAYRSDDLRLVNRQVVEAEPLPKSPDDDPVESKNEDKQVKDPNRKQSEPIIYLPRRDSTGLFPERPPGPAIPRTLPEIVRQTDGLIERFHEPEAELDAVIGQAKLLETKSPIGRVVIANPTIADVRLVDPESDDPKLLNIFGKSFGTTSLTMWDKDDRPITFLLRVSIDTKDLSRRIEQVFPGADVHISQIGGQFILDGQVPDSKTMSEVRQLIMREFGLASSTGSITAGAGPMGGAGGGAGGAGGMAGGGMMGGAGGMMSASAVNAAQMFPEFIINRIHVPGPRQVMLKVKIAELNRTALRQIGVSWLDTRNQAMLGSAIGGPNGGSVGVTNNNGPIQSAIVARSPNNPLGVGYTSSFGASGNFSSGSAQLFGVFNAGMFSLFLNALRSNQLAKLLAEPNLMALDGQPAQFLAGGQFPYPVPQSSSIPGGTAVVTVQFASFGAILQFLPQILPNDVIQLDVQPVFSQLNFAGGTTVNGGQVPAIDQRSARTVVRLKEGQTLAIAGLLQSTTNATTNRVPVLGDLPIVGPLFSSNSIQTVETELVVLVTPELVEPLDANETLPAPGDRVLEPNDFEFFFLGRIEGKTGYNFRSTVIEHDPLQIMKHYQSENTWVVGPHGHAD